MSDDTLEVREERGMDEPKGAGTFPKFLKRQKVPKGPAARPKSKNTSILIVHIQNFMSLRSHELFFQF